MSLGRAAAVCLTLLAGGCWVVLIVRFTTHWRLPVTVQRFIAERAPLSLQLKTVFAAVFLVVAAGSAAVFGPGIASAVDAGQAHEGKVISLDLMGNMRGMGTTARQPTTTKHPSPAHYAFHASGFAGRLTVAPPSIGLDRVKLLLRGPAGRSVEGSRVQLATKMLTMAMPAAHTLLEPNRGGFFGGSYNFDMPGSWRLSFTLRLPDGRLVSASVKVHITS